MRNPKQHIVHIGPDPRGIGGIESVIRTYVTTEWDSFSMSSVASRSQTVNGGRRFAYLGALWRVLGLSIADQAVDGLHFHLSHRGSFLREGSLMILARVTRVPIYATVHGSQFVATSGSLPWRPLYRKVLRSARRIGVLNTAARDAVLGLAPESQVSQLDNPGPPTKEGIRSPADCDPIAVFAGLVGERKGVDVLLRAWEIVESAYPDARLRIFGPLERGFEAPGLERYWEGAVANFDVAYALAHSRLAVLPSRAEGLPVFIIEAQAFGRPIVASDVGGIRKQIGAGGSVVGAGDAEALAAELLHYLTDPASASRDGVLASGVYGARFSLSKVNDALFQFYDAGI